MISLCVRKTRLFRLKICICILRGLLTSLSLSEVKKHICLPPRMFEDIQSKSTQICWPIPHEYLKVCLSHREALNWVNIDLAKVDLLEKDFLNIDKSNFPIKQLSFTTDYVTPAMMETVGRFASTIEILEVDFEPTGFLLVNIINIISILLIIC